MKFRFQKSILFLISSSPGSLWAQSYLIGHRTMNFTDSSRNERPVPSEVYSPSMTAGNSTNFAEGVLPDRTKAINISTLPAGYFFIEIISQKNQFYHSFIKRSSID